jgi:hypothetical protein
MAGDDTCGIKDDDATTKAPWLFLIIALDAPA